MMGALIANPVEPADEFQLWGPIKPSVERLWRRFYSDLSPLEFVHRLHDLLKPDANVLEIGAGAGQHYPHRIRGNVSRIVGVDPDPRVKDNPHLDEGIVGTCERLPLPDASFDLAFHRMLAANNARMNPHDTAARSSHLASGT